MSTNVTHWYNGIIEIYNLRKNHRIKISSLPSGSLASNISEDEAINSHGRAAMANASVRRQLAKSILVCAATIVATILIVLNHHHHRRPTLDPMADRTFIFWLHGLGDSGPANEPMKTHFTSPHFNRTSWSFPSAPSNPVTCSHGAVMPSWFDIHEIPITADSPKAESSVLEAVQSIHAKIDKVVDGGISPNNIFVCGFSQGGALTLASVLLYPKTLGGGAVFSGWVPFDSTIIDRIHPDAKRTPILWSHGSDDRVVLFEAGQAGPPFLEKAGLSCEFKAYPSLGHSISVEELKHLESWIKSRLQSSS